MTAKRILGYLACRTNRQQQRILAGRARRIPTNWRAPRQRTAVRQDGVMRALERCTPEVLCGLFPVTRQQARVLRCFLETPNDARIARVLNLSTKTVSAHLDNIRKRLGVPCRLELTQHSLVTILARADACPELREST